MRELEMNGFAWNVLTTRLVAVPALLLIPNMGETSIQSLHVFLMMS